MTPVSVKLEIHVEGHIGSILRPLWLEEPFVYEVISKLGVKLSFLEFQLGGRINNALSVGEDLSGYL